MAGETFRARVVEKRHLSPRVSELTLELAGLRPFRWRAGQYVVLGLQAAEERFPFSIARADDGRHPARLVFAVGDASIADALLSVKLDGELLLEGPYGEFTWTASPGALLVGVGTGVAPLKALAEEALAATSRTPLVLLAGQRSESDVLWAAELEALAREYPEFRFEPTLSLPAPDWRGRRGRVQEHLSELVSSLPARPSAYVCGTPAMAESVRSELRLLGVAVADLKTESY
jgi:CDP-4-dehydro-6-deoxyglucose reductase